MIIDTSKKEYADLPEILNGEILLERAKDAAGNTIGVHSISPSDLKAIALKTDVEIAAMDYQKYTPQLDFVRKSKKIIASDTQ